MGYSLEQTVPPTSEPVSLPEIKAHLRVDHTEEDDLIRAYLEAARDYVEQFTRRQLMPATWRLKLDSFPRGTWIELPKPPVRSVVSIGYTDPNGDAQTWGVDNYSLDTGTLPPRVLLGYGLAWPNTLASANAVEITYAAGYASEYAVPAAIKAAIRLLVADMYEHRESRLEVRVQENKTVRDLLWPHRVLTA